MSGSGMSAPLPTTAAACPHAAPTPPPALTAGGGGGGGSDPSAPAEAPPPSLRGTPRPFVGSSVHPVSPCALEMALGRGRHRQCGRTAARQVCRHPPPPGGLLPRGAACTTHGPPGRTRRAVQVRPSFGHCPTRSVADSGHWGHVAAHSTDGPPGERHGGGDPVLLRLRRRGRVHVGLRDDAAAAAADLQRETAAAEPSATELQRPHRSSAGLCFAMTMPRTGGGGAGIRRGGGPPPPSG